MGPDDSTQPTDAPGPSGRALGFAGQTARPFIDSPVTVLLMLATLGVGLLGLMFTPRQEDPKISVPMIDVIAHYPGVEAEQVASLVTEPLARLMSEIPGVKHVYTRTAKGQALVTVRFEVGRTLETSIVTIHDKLESNRDRVPPGVAMPIVRPVSVDDVPIVTATLWSDELDDAALRILALRVLQRLNEVANTGDGFVVGGRPEEVAIHVRPEALRGYGITLDQLARSVRQANSEALAGTVEGSNGIQEVYSGAFLTGPGQIADLMVGQQGQQPIHLRDVADVTFGPAELEHLVNFSTGPARSSEQPGANGAPAVTVAIAKKVGTNGVTVARDVLDQLDRLQGTLIPDNVHTEITRNYGKTANDKVNELLGALFEAAIAVAILCWIGLGARAALVVITVIPLVVLITVWSAWVLGYTVDRVSLFALVFAIGILVDDATVVVENIFRRWLNAGETGIPTAIDAVREVGNPTILATLTIIAALLPMGFVSGLMGPYMRPIPVLGSTAMFFSLIAAFVFTPWMAYRLRPRLTGLARAARRETRMRQGIHRVYGPLMGRLCANRGLRWGFLILLLTALGYSLSLFGTQSVAIKMLPFDDKSEFQVIVNMPEGTPLMETARVTAKLAEALRTTPEVRALQSYVGTAAPFNFNGMVRHYYLRERAWQADIQVQLLDKHQRERSSHAIAIATRHQLTPIAESLGARIEVVEMPPGPPVLQTMVAEIYGADDEARRAFAERLTGVFDEVDTIVDVDNYLSAPYTYWQFRVDTDKAQRRHVSVATINRNLGMIMGDHRLGDIKRGSVLEPTYIVLEARLGTRSQLGQLLDLPIGGGGGATGTDDGQRLAEPPRPGQGGPIPLGELGRFVLVAHEPPIYHKDLRRVEYVTGEMEGKLGAPLYGIFAVADQLKDEPTPTGEAPTGLPGGLVAPPEDPQRVGIHWSGEWTVTYETFRDLGLAFIAALILIYGLIVWEFKSFALGLLIMAPIPLTFIGIVPGHALLGAQFTATSMIGFIALAGIIVRNSILLLEFVKNEVAGGRPIVEAVIRAAEIRMRPILITALTLMAGAFAILSDPIFEGMAVSLFFGTAVATVLTLVVIPLGCLTARRHILAQVGVRQADGDLCVVDPRIVA